MRVELRDITKTFPGVLANDRVDLTIEDGKVHALLGENGAGKSTLMNVLYGLFPMDSGQISVLGRPVQIRSPSEAIALGIGMVHQDFLLIPRMTVVENVLLGISEGPGAGSFGRLDQVSAVERLESLSAEFGLDIDPMSIVRDLSVGEQQRVEILKLLFRGAELLILDEPTAVLGPVEAEGLFGVLDVVRTRGHSVVLITHKMAEVLEHTDTVTVMRAGRRIASVPTSDTSAAELAAMMIGRDFDSEMTTKVTSACNPEVILDVHDVIVKDEAGVLRVNGASITVSAGEILGIAGVDGNGQSELAEAVFGLRPVHSGTISLHGRDIGAYSVAARRKAGVRLVPAERRAVGSVAAQSLTDNVVLGSGSAFSGRAGLLDRGRARDHAISLADKYQIRTPGPSFLAGNLSGGNLQKLILGRELEAGPELLIVEQPTRGLDVAASAQIKQALIEHRNRGLAIVVISVDLDELTELSDRIAVMFDGRILGVMDAETLNLAELGMLMAGITEDPQ